MKAVLLAIFSSVIAGASWATIADVLPGEGMEPAVLTLDYERPWAGLDVSLGRAAAGLPLPAGVWFGARANLLSAPTVRENGVGAWFAWRRIVFCAIDRTEVSVSGLEPELRLDADFSLRLGAGPLGWGWSTRCEALDRDLAVWWREWWVSLGGTGIEVVAGRRTTPWLDIPLWTVGLRLAMPGSVEAGLRWKGASSALALRWTVPAARLTAATVWSGPDAGGFALRLRAGER